MLEFISHGLLPALPWWGYLALTFVTIHLTVVGVTVYYHRDQAHRALDLHPLLRGFFRFWVWSTTAMVVSEWVAVHRKHHAFVETENDPHSPQILGLRRMLGAGAEVYSKAVEEPGIVAKYARGTPDDRFEHFCARYKVAGVTVLGIIELALFGAPGVAIWAAQMLAMPLLASALVNGLGHHSGYRNFELPDASANVLPFGFIAGGEELHNNHHAFPSSAKFSLRPFEFDIGWCYIRALSALGLARVRRTYPRPHFSPCAPSTPSLDVEALRAVVTNRMHVLRAYRREVLMPVLREELARRSRRRHFRRDRRLLMRDAKLLDEAALTRRKRLIARFPRLAAAWRYREGLRAIWEERAISNEGVLERLREWVATAEKSDLTGLAEFAARLRTYRLPQTA
ncbi:MAG: DesA family fatty acid desaturase [Gammaproteobacteria bacterium]